MSRSPERSSRGLLALLPLVVAGGCAVDVASVGDTWGGGPAPVDPNRPVTVAAADGALDVGLPLLVDAPPGDDLPVDPDVVRDTVAVNDTIRRAWRADSLRAEVGLIAVDARRESARTTAARDSAEAVLIGEELAPRWRLIRARRDAAMRLAGRQTDSILVRRQADSARAQSGLEAVRATVQTIEATASQGLRAAWNLGRCSVWSAWATPADTLPPPAGDIPPGLRFVSGEVAPEYFRSDQRRSIRTVLRTPPVTEELRNEVGELDARLVVRVWLEGGAEPPIDCPSPAPSPDSTASTWYVLDFGSIRPVEGTIMGLGAWVIGVVALTGLLSLVVG